MCDVWGGLGRPLWLQPQASGAGGEGAEEGRTAECVFLLDHERDLESQARGKETYGYFSQASKSLRRG